LTGDTDMPKWKLIVEYEGTRYRGWQEQTNARTVQGELRKAAENVFGRSVEIVGAGRTDAGVHALYQVAHLKSSMPIREPVLKREINDRLPSDISIRDISCPPSCYREILPLSNWDATNGIWQTFRLVGQG
jgi:tRNA pseudouridine38-40 synthase